MAICIKELFENLQIYVATQCGFGLTTTNYILPKFQTNNRHFDVLLDNNVFP